MPLYEYQCDVCGDRFEKIRKFSDPPVEVCPKCGGTVHKLISAPAFQLKGTGWYATDYPKKDAGNSSAARDAKDAKDEKAGTSEKKDGTSEKSSSTSDAAGAASSGSASAGGSGSSDSSSSSTSSSTKTAGSTGSTPPKESKP